MTAEENAKRLFNKRILKTFLIILLPLGGVSLTSAVLFIWVVLTDNLTLGAYAAQCFGNVVGYSVIIIDSIIILRNKDVHDAWNGCHH